MALPTRLALFGAFQFVWFGFMRDQRRTFTETMLWATFHNMLQCFFLPTRFFFSHVLLAVLLSSAVRGLLRDPSTKDTYYDLEAALVDVPILLATFGEALGCDDYLLPIGGHVWFDMVVPVMFGVYFAVLAFDPHSWDQKAKGS